MPHLVDAVAWGGYAATLFPVPFRMPRRVLLSIARLTASDRRRRSLLAALLAGVCGVALLGCSDDDSRQVDRQARSERRYRPDVLLIVVDTLRWDHLSTYGYERPTSPHLDALAREGIRFEHAVAQAPWTTPSVGALLTSRHPTQLQITDFPNQLREDLYTLPEALDDAGYATTAVVSHFFLNSEWNFDQGFDIFDESNILGHAGVSSPGVTDRAIELLDKTFGEAPGFLFVHYFDPHYAYIEHANHRFAQASGYDGWLRSGTPFQKIRAKEQDLDEADLAYMKALYDSEIAFTDMHIGRLLNALRERRQFDDTLIIFTADHGEGFMEHGHLGHTVSLYEELIHVPLIIKWPRQRRGSIEPRPVQLVDVYPTLLGHLGMNVSAPLMGRVIGGPGWPRPAISETSRAGRELRSIFDGRFKLIHDLKTRTSELYDLDADPGETTDLAAQRTALRERMQKDVTAVYERLERAGRAADAENVELTSDDQKRLEALGYVE